SGLQVPEVSEPEHSQINLVLSFQIQAFYRAALGEAKSHAFQLSLPCFLLNVISGFKPPRATGRLET
ncbi:hypothetical protein, partial [Acetobacter pomorum]|uniref:hypothetical protein n=1 Tax=Acetobacter pomorum TaxID=65959 RepID=UPI001F363A70